MAEGHPWGMGPPLIFECSDLYSQGGWENQPTLLVWVSVPISSLVWPVLIFVALFLASPAAAYVTGAHIILDGGGLISGAASARL
jgi:hypothetical protein